MRVIVVGGGIYGQVITWRLALRGVAVIQIEAMGPANARSQSGDKSRIVRGLYGRASWAETGARSLPLWTSWGNELGVELVRLCGMLYLEHESRGKSDDQFRDYLDNGMLHLSRLGQAIEVLSPEEITRRFPAMSSNGLVRAVFEPGGGIGWAAKATRGIAMAGARTGNVEYVGETALRIHRSSAGVSGVTITAGSGERMLYADHVVIAAGQGGVALVEALLGKQLGIRAIPHFTSYWDVPWPSGRGLSIDALPPWAELGGYLYGFPDDGENGFKVAWHEPLRDKDAPHTDERDWHLAPTESETEALRQEALKRFPALASATLRGTFQCRYDATDDENFQVGAVPGIDGLTFVGGMSGHGFKHAPVIGESVAQKLVGESPIDELTDYAIRFAPSST